MSARARWYFRNAHALLPWLVFGLTSVEVLAQTAAQARPPLEPVVVSLVLNGTLVADAQLLHRELASRSADPADQAGSTRMWIPEKEAMGWRMDVSTRERRTIEGIAHAAFCDARDRCFYDEATAVLTVTLETSNILVLRITPTVQDIPRAEEVKSVGGYLNYDVSAWQIGQPGASILLDGRVHSPYGHGAVRLGGVISGGRSAGTLAQAVWQIDRPQQGYSLQFGSITIPDTALSAGLSLTGLRMGSNPRLQPMVSNTLRPRLEGLADRSLRADLFIDGLFRQTEQVPYGPYSIELQPLYPGRGEIDLVSTDISGLQLRRTLPFYNAPQMLTPGATEWSVDAGVLTSQGRGMTLPQPALVSAMLRRGLSAELTAQAQVLAAGGAARVTVSADSAHPSRGLSSLSMVWQRSQAYPQGRLWLGAGHEYLARESSVSVRTEQSQGGCNANAVVDPLADRLWRPCRLLNAAFGFSLGGRWTASASAEARQDTSTSHVRLTSLSARTQVGTRSQLGLSLQQVVINNMTTTGFFVTWSQPLGSSHEAQVSLQARSGEDASLQWSTQSLPSPDAQEQAQRFQTYGSVGQRNEVGARWIQRSANADWRVDAQVDQRGVSGSVGVTGAIGMAEGRVFRSRRIDDAFIIVDVGLPDLPVLLDNREVARTNAAGWAVVTEGRAHQANTVGVDTSGLPIEYAIPRDQQSVVPASSAGVVARFDVSDGGVAVVVRDMAGQALPTGSMVRISTQLLPTAITSRGEVFLERSDRAAEVIIEWSGKRCRFSYQPQAEPLGGYRCITVP